MQDDGRPRGVLRDRLRLGTGFAEDERDEVLDRLGALDARLRSFRPEAVELELSVKERNRADQRVTLECSIAGLPRLVATSSAQAVRAALIEVRDNLVRQVDDATTRREARRA